MSEAPWKVIVLITWMKAKWQVRVLCHLFAVHRSVLLRAGEEPH